MVHFGLLCLPMEVIYHISKYLSLEDIINCSQTCHHLRSGLNINWIWKRWLPEQDVAYLEFEEPQVEPMFQVDEMPLSPLCENRQNLMRIAYLMNNWANGRFVENIVETPFSFASMLYKTPKGKGQLIYNNRYIFLGMFSKNDVRNMILVWDVQKNPVLCAAIKIKIGNYDTFYIIGKYLVLIECIKVKVFEINMLGKKPEEKFLLIYSFLITDSKVACNQSVDHSNGHDYTCTDWEHSSAGQYLMFHKYTINDSCCGFHVWDIFNASKVGYFVPSIEGCSIKIHSFDGNDWVLEQKIESGTEIYYYRFNVKLREFYDSIFKYKLENKNTPSVTFYKSHVIIVFKKPAKRGSKIWFPVTCVVYGFYTSKEIKRRSFDKVDMSDDISSIILVNGKFVLFHDYKFHIIDALSLKCINHLEFEEECFIRHQFCLFGSLFVITYSCFKIQLWNITSKKKFPLVWDRNDHVWDLFYLNDLGTELVYTGNNEIGVLHFW